MRVWIVALVLALSPAAASAGERFGGSYDVGIGGMLTRPYGAGGVLCGTLAMTGSAHVTGPGSVQVELAAAWGNDFEIGGQRQNLRPSGGKQSLLTAVGGVELRRHTSGPFASAGLGVGRSTMSGARDSNLPPPDGVVPAVERSGLAYSFCLGYVFPRATSGARIRLVLRRQALADCDLATMAHATVLCAGADW